MRDADDLKWNSPGLAAVPVPSCGFTTPEEIRILTGGTLRIVHNDTL
jgi:hypothetical protein